MTKPVKVKKPRVDFPLFVHQTDRWCKKIRQRLHYFGKASADPKGVRALEKWLAEKDELLAGRTPRGKVEGVTVADVANRFLTVKRSQLESRELAPTSFSDLYAACRRLVIAFGPGRLVADLAADDFHALRNSLAKTCGPVRLGVEVQRVRTIFKFAYETNLVNAPVRFGPSFVKPSLRTLRLSRAEKGPKLFEPSEILRMLAAATVPIRAMILLGINAGYGNTDCANVPIRAFDLQNGWVDFARPKTGVPRRCPLWLETVAAVRDAIDRRPAAADSSLAKLTFLTPRGGKWVYSKATTFNSADQLKVSSDDLLGKEFRSLLKRLGLYQPGKGFYVFRHCTETVGSGAKDQKAVDAIMGHAPHASDMSAVYREKIDDDRLVAVVNHVRQWLFGTEENK